MSEYFLAGFNEGGASVLKSVNAERSEIELEIRIMLLWALFSTTEILLQSYT